MNTENSEYNDIQRVKRRFFAMRNGVIADVLRKGGSPFRIIFGLNLPQLVEIAAEFAPDAELGKKLWANTTTRESMLLAPMLMDPASFTRELATDWISGIPAVEIADILCHRLLRKTPYALNLAKDLATSDCDMHRYVAVRLMFNLVGSYPTEAKEIAQKTASVPCPLTDSVSAALISEAAYLSASE